MQVFAEKNQQQNPRKLGTEAMLVTPAVGRLKNGGYEFEGNLGSMVSPLELTLPSLLPFLLIISPVHLILDSLVPKLTLHFLATCISSLQDT